ncbi:cadherin-like domain-containing protein [Clostridium sp. YIM B02515]|uniref:Cadherin-like domain-containing protein n=1 Tax=Clostridium rhizosphaerae TaxID=2803861 RepID=A0ABS1TCX7_9CLOT|nr:cadherin-like domain-containing protein [Clostridium rhizosphaerae]MBL4937198.1 cadherin-like domain-containing protein [Clostridium rhizosphaerae]
MKKKGSALVLMVAVISLLLILSVSIATSSSSTFKTAFAFDYMDKVNLAAQSGIEKGMSQLGMKSNMKHLSGYLVGNTASSIPEISLTFDNNISCSVSFDTSDSDNITIYSYAHTSDNKYQKKLTKVVAKNNKPVANPDGKPDSITVSINNEIHINVLANDIDEDGDILSITNVTAASKGNVSINPDGSDLIYKATSAGDDTFTYTISDGYGGESVGVVNVKVTSVNTPPIGEEDSKTVNLNSTTSINVLANDSDDDNDNIIVSRILTSPKNGNIVSFGNDIVYKATSIGTDVFTYEISDGRGGVGSAKVTVNIIDQSATINSGLFTTMRKFMVGSVTTNTANDSLNFSVKPGNGNILSGDENFLLLNPIQNGTGFSNNYTFSKGNNTHGVKVTSDNFFTIGTSTSNVVPQLNNSGTFGMWILYSGRYYYKSNSDLVIDPSLNNAFMQGLMNNNTYPRVILVNGNITLKNITSQFSSKYLDQLVIYSTGGYGQGTINLNNCILGSYQNKNKMKDIDICFIANTLNIIGSNTVSYARGNSSLPSVGNDPVIRAIITNNIQSSINWK